MRPTIPTDAKSCEKTYDTLSKLLPEFAIFGKFDLIRFGCSDSETLKSLFQTNNARYHHQCVARFNKQKLLRAKAIHEKEQDKLNDHDLDSKRLRRSDPENQIELGETKCLFCLQLDDPRNLCAAGTLHAKSKTLDLDHVHEFTDRIKNNALKINNMKVLSHLSSGDVTTNELFYHKNCLVNFNNQYQSEMNKETNMNNSTQTFQVEL